MPRRRSPGIGPWREPPSSRPIELSSCHGTVVIMTPGVNCRRARSRSALWLCSTFSHQWPTTYCGTKTTTSSRGLSRRIAFT
jgi:hypothetical protein